MHAPPPYSCMLPHLTSNTCLCDDEEKKGSMASGGLTWIMRRRFQMRLQISRGALKFKCESDTKGLDSPNHFLHTPNKTKHDHPSRPCEESTHPHPHTEKDSTAVFVNVEIGHPFESIRSPRVTGLARKEKQKWIFLQCHANWL